MMFVAAVAVAACTGDRQPGSGASRALAALTPADISPERQVLDQAAMRSYGEPGAPRVASGVGGQRVVLSQLGPR